MPNPILKLGGAGISLSRKETAERLNPIIRKHYALNHTYENAIASLQDRATADKLNEYQRNARMDIGKLADSIHSAGGVAYNGTDLEAADFSLSGGPDEIVRRLLDLEQDLQQTVVDEMKLKHQIRTLAILGNVKANSQNRLDFLNELAKKHRPATANV